MTNKPGDADTRWECIHKTDSRQHAHILAGRLISLDIPAVIVPKNSSAYSFAVPGYFEVWVPLLLAPEAVSIIHDATGPLQPD